MTAKIKSSQIKMFMNTTPAAAATYSLIGDGVKSLKVNYNPKTTEETYVHQDNASISVDSYAPTVPVEMTAKAGDAAFEYIDSLRKARAVLADAETDVVSVWLYETPALGEYPAEKQSVSIQIDDMTIEGGVAVKINYTINYIGDPVQGTFNPTTSAFTAS
ncbi:MAG: hypothetical protein IPL32_18105 [Chloracidobacterium sp.]|nr:hypothetical protein [Chloracidobacterium sp.]